MIPLSEVALQILYAFRYPFFGLLSNGRNIHNPFKNFMNTPKRKFHELDEFMDAYFSEYVELYDAKITVGLSGGLDSTFILANLIDYDERYAPGLNINALNISFGSYSEVEQAEKVAKFFGVSFRHVELKPADIKREFPTIVRKLCAPFDRGSVIPTYFLCKYADDLLVVGDSGDAIFKPSMKSDYRFLMGMPLNKIYQKLSDADLNSIFRHPIFLGFWQKEFFNPLNRLRYIELMSEIPYYYQYRYDVLKRDNQQILLPYQQFSALDWGFRDYRASVPGKLYLRRWLKDKGLPINLLAKKKALKIDPTEYCFLDDLLDADLLLQTGLYKRRDFENEPNPWIHYFDILTSVYLKEMEINGVS